MNILDFLCRHREFDQKLAQSRERLYRLAYSWCHQAALADDLVQDTCAKALKQRGKLRDEKVFDSWLFRILANTWYDHLRLKKDFVEFEDVYLEDGLTPEIANSRFETITEVRAAIALLPIGQRQVLSLVELEQFSYVEVAEVLQIPIGTVMSRLCRARRQLKQILLGAENEQATNVTPIRSLENV